MPLYLISFLQKACFLCACFLCACYLCACYLSILYVLFILIVRIFFPMLFRLFYVKKGRKIRYFPTVFTPFFFLFLPIFHKKRSCFLSTFHVLFIHFVRKGRDFVPVLTTLFLPFLHKGEYSLYISRLCDIFIYTYIM